MKNFIIIACILKNFESFKNKFKIENSKLVGLLRIMAIDDGCLHNEQL